MKVCQRFGNREQIYNKIFNLFAFYMIFFATVMFIAGGDGIYFGIFVLGFILLIFFINRVFAKFNTQINEIIILDNSIKFKYTEKNKLQIVEFDIENIKIKADIFAFIHQYSNNAFNNTLPNAFITLSIIQKDGSISKIEDNCDDISHSLELLKFLKQLDCFSYELKADTFEYQAESINLENAIGNYLAHNVYNKKTFKYYYRKMGNIIGVLGFLFIFTLFAFVITFFGLEMVV